ncbi:hypothetical protein N015_18780 [Pseudomonas asturiensis]|uniref:DUF3298 domain-containing protein n=1 Tax=Pseudomonas asturiensis TaxID=1190415 RepID=A0ABX6HFZ0_9PSED|nr:DUF3298 domain-containing protein [Pseudomonas asturiensis]QHF04341.1 hypothetical protein N015_18780 [Pseudomonas asturiensis]
MSTKEQDVVLTKNKLAEFKSRYVDAITQYVLKTQGEWDSGVATSSILDVQRTGAEYYNFCEEFVGNSSLLGAHDDGLWAQGFAEDCYAILQTMPQHFSLLQVVFERLQIEGNYRPSSTEYANMQRLCKKYLKAPLIRSLRQSLVENCLPTYGLDNREGFTLTSGIRIGISFVFGVVFLVAVIVIAIILPNPTDFQYVIFRLVASLSAAGVVAVMSGFIEVKFGSWLRAGGALAVFAAVFWTNPAEKITSNRPSETVPEQNLPVNPPIPYQPKLEYRKVSKHIKDYRPDTNVEVATIELEYVEVSGLGDAYLEKKINSQIRHGIGVNESFDGTEDRIMHLKSAMIDGGVLSIVVEGSFYGHNAAGAHNEVVSLNINIRNGEPVEFKDLFRSGYIEKINVMASTELEKTIPGNWFKTVSDNQCYYFDSSYLYLCFSEGEAAAGANGIVTVRLGLDNLRGLVSLNSPLAFIL